MVRILLFGAGGRAGRAVLGEARARGHQVTAAVRDRATYADLATSGVDLVEADALDTDGVATIAPGHDVAVNAVRPDWANPLDYFTRMNSALLSGLQSAGVPRLVLIGGAGTLDVGDGTQFVDTPAFPDPGNPRALSQREALRDLRARQVSIDWVCLTPPPRFLPHGPRTGRYRIRDSYRLAETTGTQISYADFAVGVLDEIETPRHHREPILLTG